MKSRFYNLPVKDESDCTFAAIIAVLPDTPPNCIVVQVGDSSLEVLQLLSHKSGVSYPSKNWLNFCD